MVYAAYGIQGLTGIVGTFFVKDYLDLSAEFLAALAFWAGIPWAVKMPVGHVVGLISYFDAMRAVMSGERWFVISSLLGPSGYMIQDAVADAMTVEAVPRVDESGKPYDEASRKGMHTTMQTLGRVAIIGGLALVALVNVFLFHGTDALPRERKAEMYALVYTIALVIPVLSVLGVVLHG